MIADEAWERLQFQTTTLEREFDDAADATSSVRDALLAARRLSTRLGEQRLLVHGADETAATLGYEARTGFAEVESLERRLESAAESARRSFGSLESAAAAESNAGSFAADALDRLQALHEAVAEQRNAVERRPAGGLWADR